MNKQNILIVEDTASLAMIYEECMKQSGYCTHIAENGAKAFSILDNLTPDAILLDLKLPDMNGLDILRSIRKNNMLYPVIVITAQASINTAVEAMQAGADDFVAKPVSPERLQITVANALEKNRLKKIVHTYEDIKRDNFCGFIGASLEMQSIYHIIESAATSKAAVMITGESGTGKELVAQAIHQLSQRNSKNIVALNCAAIPHNLLESELFGHMKGAFTGAIANREGAAKLADGGTLFLDELGEMPLELQSKILRFIQTRSFMPVGSANTETVDVRFICATNRDPMEAIEQGVLREDLYYRLNVIPIHMPPLRERGDDIILLAEEFLKKASSEEGKGFKSLTPETQLLLLHYNWQGNVRELENIIWNAAVMHDGKELTPDMLRLNTNGKDSSTQQNSSAIEDTHEKDKAPNPFSPVIISSDQIRPFSDIEEDVIKNAIAACKGNISEAARRLHISPSTIHRKQKSWN